MNLKNSFLLLAILFSLAPAYADAARRKHPVRASCESFFLMLDAYNDCLKKGHNNCQSVMDLEIQDEFKALGIKWLPIRIARCTKEHRKVFMSPLSTSLCVYKEPEITQWLKTQMKQHGFKCHLRLFNDEVKKLQGQSDSHEQLREQALRNQSFLSCSKLLSQNP